MPGPKRVACLGQCGGDVLDPLQAGLAVGRHARGVELDADDLRAGRRQLGFIHLSQRMIELLVDGESGSYAGALAVSMEVADDDDGDDEILKGSNLIDGKGNLLWTQNLGHVDQMIPGDIDPDNPG